MKIDAIIVKGIIKSVLKGSMKETLIIMKVCEVGLINCSPHINNILLQ